MWLLDLTSIFSGFVVTAVRKDWHNEIKALLRNSAYTVNLSYLRKDPQLPHKMQYSDNNGRYLVQMPDLLVSHKRLLFPYDSAIWGFNARYAALLGYSSRVCFRNWKCLWSMVVASYQLLLLTTLTTECLNLWYFLVNCFDMTCSRKEIKVKSWARSWSKTVP